MSHSFPPRRSPDLEPIARAGFVLDREIIANAEKFGVAQRPFAIDAFRTVSARHPAPDAPPDKMHRRMVGQQGHGVDGLGACEKPRRAWPGCRPPDLRDRKSTRLNSRH